MLMLMLIDSFDSLLHRVEPAIPKLDIRSNREQYKSDSDSDSNSIEDVDLDSDCDCGCDLDYDELMMGDDGEEGGNVINNSRGRSRSRSSSSSSSVVLHSLHQLYGVLV